MSEPKVEPKEVQEMRQSLSAFSATARRVARGVKESQRNLRIDISQLPSSKAGHVLTDEEKAALEATRPPATRHG